MSNDRIAEIFDEEDVANNLALIEQCKEDQARDGENKPNP